MAGHYPSILFHFTDKQGLFGILNSNFRVSYAKETIRGKNKTTKFAAPMVSFCDLRLSELGDHMIKYGRYGVGMSKEWANANNLNTVNYINAHCSLTDSLIDSVEYLFEFQKEIDELTDLQRKKDFGQAYMSIMNLYRYTKNYEGPNTKLNIPNYRYADEREWRYVPHIDHNFWPFLSAEQVDTKEKKKSANALFDEYPLYFEPKDIRYIIVEREDERDEIISHVFQAKESKYGHDESRRLASRILSAEQIINDV